MKVLITEKPAVAREFAKVLRLNNEKKEEGYIEGKSSLLGCDIRVTWAVGHLITLSYPDKYSQDYGKDLSKWSLDTLPFLPDEYKFEPIKNVKKQFDIIKKLYHDKSVDEIILAGDSAREGIYIQYLIVKEANVNNSIPQTVVWINSQTDDEIKKGLNDRKPVSFYKDLIDAGRARAIEDYAIGINFSRALSCKFGYGFNKKINSKKYTPIAVGRVMTCVLGMIVRREREIRDFKETYFYKPTAKIDDISANWKAIENTPWFNSPEIHNNEGFLDKAKGVEFINNLQNPLTVIKAEKKREKKNAPLLFNLAELQNECSKSFKLSPDSTLEIAQKLYEAKLTTYPRTDARVLSSAVADEIDKNLKGLSKMSVCKEYVEHILTDGSYKSLKTTKYVDDSKISDHYAIIPTGEGSLSGLSDLERKVYERIVKRFLAIFYPPAEYNKIEVEFVSANNEHFFISEKLLDIRGYLEISGSDEEKKKDSKLDSIKKGDTYSAAFSLTEGKTNPPKRYTSGSMILAMENAGNLIEDEELRAQIKSSGIGTSATRAGIISKLIEISYIKLDKKTQVLSPTDTGEILYDIVDANLPALLKPNMTASWEKGLSQIENATVTFDAYIQKMNEFIIKEITNIKSQKAEKAEEFTSEEIGICPLCGSTVVTTRNGYKCEKYDKDAGCHFYVGAIGGQSIDRDQVEKLINTGETDILTGLKSKKGTSFEAKLVINKDENKIDLAFADVEEEIIGQCPLCGGNVVKTFNGYKCENYSRDDDGCQFYASKILGHTFTVKEIKSLLDEGKTPLIKGLKGKKGKFDAFVVIDKEENRLALEFPPREGDNVPEEETDFDCVKCGSKLIRNHNSVYCKCGFKLYTTIAQKKLSDDAIRALLAGRTGIMDGFVSKKGKWFQAALEMSSEGKVSFIFPDKES